MDSLRAILAICVFAVSCYLVFDLFATGFNWFILIAAISGFILVHFIWPREHQGDAWYDALEFIFDLPYRLIANSIRALVRGIKNSDVDAGIDL